MKRLIVFFIFPFVATFAFAHPDKTSFSEYLNRPAIKTNYDLYFNDPVKFERDERQLFLTNNIITPATADAFMIKFMKVYDCSARTQYRDAKLTETEKAFLKSVLDDESLSGILWFPSAYTLYLDTDDVDFLLKGLQGNPFEMKMFTEIKDDEFSTLLKKTELLIISGNVIETNKFAGAMRPIDSVGFLLGEYIKAMDFQKTLGSERKQFLENLIDQQNLHFVDVVSWSNVAKQLQGKHNAAIEELLEVLINHDYYQCADKIITGAPDMKAICLTLLHDRLERLVQMQTDNKTLSDHLSL